MTIEAAINALNTVVADIDGLRRVYVDPPESINEFPCAITYIGEGTYSGGGDVTIGLHTLILDIYEKRTILPQAVDQAKQWPDKVLAALRASLDLTETVSHVGNRDYFVRYRAQPMQYNDTTYYGVRFWIPVKLNY